MDRAGCLISMPRSGNGKLGSIGWTLRFEDARKINNFVCNDLHLRNMMRHKTSFFIHLPHRDEQHPEKMREAFETVVISIIDCCYDLLNGQSDVRVTSKMQPDR